jgi:hypothetical protein
MIKTTCKTARANNLYQCVYDDKVSADLLLFSHDIAFNKLHRCFIFS